MEEETVKKMQRVTPVTNQAPAVSRKRRLTPRKG